MELTKIKKYFAAFFVAVLASLFLVVVQSLMDAYILQSWMHTSSSSKMFSAGAFGGYIFCRILNNWDK